MLIMEKQSKVKKIMTITKCRCKILRDQLKKCQMKTVIPTPEESINLEPEELRRRGERPTGNEDPEDQSDLEFPQLKRKKTVELPDESDEERSPVYPLHLPGRRWPNVGP